MNLGIIAAQAKRTYRFLITPASVATTDLYFDLSLAPAGFWNKVRSDGGDIRVFAQDGVTPVAREVSGFDYANKLGALFIATSGATAFYITCGTGAAEPAPDSTYGKYAVWESTAKGVFHLEEGAGNARDSTSNQSTANNTSATNITGKVNNGVAFNGSAKLDSGNVSALDFTGATPMTILCWAKYTTVANLPLLSKGGGVDHGTVGWSFSTNLGHQLVLILNAGTSYNVNELEPCRNVGTLNDNNYHLVAVTYDGSKTRNGTSFFRDGDGGVATADYAHNLTDSISNSSNFLIGNQPNGTGFPGSIDEARIYSRALSPTEIATMYANQNDPASFWTIGAGA